MTAVETTARDLTPELLDLMDHEKVIEQGMQTFVDVGTALLAIRDGKKYRHAGYATFEHYCQRRWSISQSRGHQLMSAASIAQQLGSSTNVEVLPTREAQVRPLQAVPVDQRAEVWAEAVAAADGDQPSANQVMAAARHRVLRQPPKRDHPAPFSDKILEKIGEHLPTEGVVLDPFAGTGRIHELATEQRRTVGVEIQPKWAEKHPDTIVGNALDLAAVIEAESVDAIATSPTYGNRMADHHDAKDDSVRLTYTHTHGEPLAADNSGTLQWGDEYRKFHRKAWAEAVRALKPGGTFVVNCKNHIRNKEVQHVVEWHITTLCRDLGLELMVLDEVVTRGLAAGDNSDVRVDREHVLSFRKPEVVL